MKNILVATDFSQTAHAAAVFSAEMARQTGARLVLFHAYHPAVLLEEETIWTDPEMLEKEVQEKMDALAHELHKSYGISVTRVLKPGFAVDEILQISKKVKADLLVIGTLGAGKRTKPGYGKICMEVLKKAGLPVICLAEATTLEEFEQLINLPETGFTAGNEAGLALVKAQFAKSDLMAS